MGYTLPSSEEIEEMNKAYAALPKRTFTEEEFQEMQNIQPIVMLGSHAVRADDTYAKQVKEDGSKCIFRVWRPNNGEKGHWIRQFEFEPGKEF
jgi:hypothetical protein